MVSAADTASLSFFLFDKPIVYQFYPRNTLKNIYDNREAILKEPLSSNAFANKGLRLRTKLSRQQKLFEDRLAEVTLNFSKRMNIDIGLVTQIAQVRIVENNMWNFSSFTVKPYNMGHVI